MKLFERAIALTLLSLLWVGPTQAERQLIPMQTTPDRDDSKFIERLHEAKSVVEVYYPRATRNERVEISVQGNILDDCYYAVYVGDEYRSAIAALNEQRQAILGALRASGDNEVGKGLERQFQQEAQSYRNQYERKERMWADSKDECYEALEAYEVVIYSLKDH